MAILLYAFSLNAQTTLVTGTVKDLNGIAYAGGAMKAGLVFAGTPVSNPTLQISNLAQCRANGFGSAPCQVPFNPNAGPFTLDPFGNIAGGGITLQDNSLVTPAGTQWAFTVSESGVSPPVGTGPQTCSATLTISGVSQSISSSFLLCPALVVSFSNQTTVLLSTSFQDAQNALPSSGGSSGLGGGVIDSRNCLSLPASALNFGTFTQTKPLMILLGPCVYNFNQILLTNPGGNLLLFHMMGCGFSCSALIGTNTTVGQSLITMASNNQSEIDLLFQDFGVFNSGTAGQDVFNFTPSAGNSLNGMVFQRLWIGFGALTGGTTGSAIKIDNSAQSNTVSGGYERILIDDNRVEQKAGLAISAISLIGTINQGTRITHNHLETTSASVVGGTAISLTSASATSFPSNVLIESNTVIQNYLVMVEADGAVGTTIDANSLEEAGSTTGTRNGIQMQVGTGTVHSSLNVNTNTFNVNSNIAYILKTTDASATATFSGNVITGNPVTVFSGFTNNLVARNNTGAGLAIPQWEPTLFANLGTPPNGSFVYCSDCTVATPCAGAGTGALAKRLAGIWVCN